MLHTFGVKDDSVLSVCIYIMPQRGTRELGSIMTPVRELSRLILYTALTQTNAEATYRCITYTICERALLSREINLMNSGLFSLIST